MTNVRWSVILLLFFAVTINDVDRAVIGVLKPVLDAALGWDQKDYGWMVTAFQAAYAVGYVASGPLLDRRGVRAGFSMAVVVWSLAAMAHAAVTSVAGFSAARAMLGLAEGATLPASVKAVTEWFPKERRAFATGFFNAATRKYVMIGKHILPVYDPDIPGQPRVTGGVSFFNSDTPAGDFTYVGHEMLPAGSGTDYHRDLAAFQDTDGKAYVISAHDQHAPTGNLMITQLTADYLRVEKVVCEVPYPQHEAPYIIKMKGRYWLFVSGHGAGAWGGSPTSYATASNLAGPWSAFKAVRLSPASKTGFDSQSDFLFEVKGSAGSFVLWGADRWSQRTKTGVGKNVWLPLQWEGSEPLLKWYPTWIIDAGAGTWTADPEPVGTPPTRASRGASPPSSALALE